MKRDACMRKGMFEIFLKFSSFGAFSISTLNIGYVLLNVKNEHIVISVTTEMLFANGENSMVFPESQQEDPEIWQKVDLATKR